MIEVEFLLIGRGGCLEYCGTWKVLQLFRPFGDSLPCVMVYARAVNTQTERLVEVNQKLDGILAVDWNSDVTPEPACGSV